MPPPPQPPPPTHAHLAARATTTTTEQSAITKAGPYLPLFLVFVLLITLGVCLGRNRGSFRRRRADTDTDADTARLPFPREVSLVPLRVRRSESGRSIRTLPEYTAEAGEEEVVLLRRAGVGEGEEEGRGEGGGEREGPGEGEDGDGGREAAGGQVADDATRDAHPLPLPLALPAEGEAGDISRRLSDASRPCSTYSLDAEIPPRWTPARRASDAEEVDIATPRRGLVARTPTPEAPQVPDSTSTSTELLRPASIATATAANTAANARHSMCIIA